MSRAVTMEKVVNLAKRRGFAFQSSEIYGGLASCWDYGPIGVELKRNVKEAWWRDMVLTRADIVGIDCAIPRGVEPRQRLLDQQVVRQAPAVALAMPSRKAGQRFVEASANPLVRFCKFVLYGSERAEHVDALRR